MHRYHKNFGPRIQALKKWTRTGFFNIGLNSEGIMGALYCWPMGDL